MIGDVDLRSDMSGSEWKMGLWGKWPVALYAAGLLWNILGLVRWLSLYDMVAMFNASGPVCWSLGLRLMVRSSKSRRHWMCQPRLSICASISSRVLIYSCLGWLERFECVCVCIVWNPCVFGVCLALWCIDYFTGFYNSPNQLLTNHMQLEMKYFWKVLLNHTYL